jgi:hypothetical protein
LNGERSAEVGRSRDSTRRRLATPSRFDDDEGRKRSSLVVFAFLRTSNDKFLKNVASHSSF